MSQLVMFEDRNEKTLGSFSRKIEICKETNASPWMDWKIAREIEDDCFHFRVVGAYRRDRVRGLTDEQREEIDSELESQGYRNDTTRGKWPEGPTPDRMIAERIGVDRFDSRTGGAHVTQDRQARARYERVARYLMPALNARVPAAIKRGRDTYESDSVVGPMLVECVAWWYNQHDEWPGPEDFDDVDLPPVDFVERYTDGVEDLVSRAQAYFN